MRHNRMVRGIGEGDMPCNKDLVGSQGATYLLDYITRYWAERHRDFRGHLYPVVGPGGGPLCNAYGIKSNCLNGVPPRMEVREWNPPTSN